MLQNELDYFKTHNYQSGMLGRCSSGQSLFQSILCVCTEIVWFAET